MSNDFLDLQYDEVESLMTLDWLAGFIEAEGSILYKRKQSACVLSSLHYAKKKDSAASHSCAN